MEKNKEDEGEDGVGERRRRRRRRREGPRVSVMAADKTGGWERKRRKPAWTDPGPGAGA